MQKTIDCLFIGHNEMEFDEYEKTVAKMGTHSGAYRDLNLNFIKYGRKNYPASEIFNLFYCNDPSASDERKPLHLGESFNLAIAYLGTYLHRRGFTFDFVNSFQEHKEDLALKLQQQNVLSVGIITTLYVSVFPILKIVEFVRRHNPDTKIIIGGPFVSNQVRALEKMELDFSFKSIGADVYIDSSQGEATLVKVLQSLKQDRDLGSVNNIYFKNGNEFTMTPIERENNSLADNMVDWSLFETKVDEFVNVRTSISCPFHCSFCGFPEHAGKYQTAPVEAIGNELDRLARAPSLKSVQFIDDTFNVPVKRFKDILRMLIQKKYDFRWHSHFRCQFADRETVEMMKESGCEGVFLGIESGSDQILKNMNKATTVEKYYKGVELLKEYGILTYGSFIIGFPGETEDTVRQSIRFIEQSGIDFFRAQLWYCDTVTPIWQEREKYGIEGSHFEWSHNTMDSHMACDIVDRIFLTIKEPVWVPQYNFECDGLFHLLHRGFSLDRIKDFINGFNQGVREKLTQPAQREASFDVIKLIKNACQDSLDSDSVEQESSKIIEKYEADFDF